MSKNHGKLYYDLLDDNLSKSAIVFFTLLLSNSNQKGYAFGSNKYYADKLKCFRFVDREIKSNEANIEDSN